MRQEAADVPRGRNGADHDHDEGDGRVEQAAA